MSNDNWRGMEMNCEHAATIVAQWESHGELQTADHDLLSAHLKECKECRQRYSAVVLLINRDRGLHTGLAAELPEPPALFSRATMERLLRRRPVIQLSVRRLPRWSVAAAAAMVLVVAGFLFYSQRAESAANQLTVHFILDAPGANKVALVGSFTQWNPDKLLLKRESNSSEWEISVPLKRGETYLYNFVIDDRTWIPDPSMRVQVSDGFGGESSLIQL